jgi:hypothetical protein
MKRKILTLIALTFIMGITSTCDEEEIIANKGRDAGKAFCDCVKDHSKDYCLDKLKDKYLYSDYTSSKFISEFNDTNPCGAELELIKTSSKAIPDSKENLLIFKSEP